MKAPNDQPKTAQSAPPARLKKFKGREFLMFVEKFGKVDYTQCLRVKNIRTKKVPKLFGIFLLKIIDTEAKLSCATGAPTEIYRTNRTSITNF